jgi:DivIVA domain-containing protein
VTAPRFPLVRFREGYHVGEVDDFLAKVEPRVTGRPDGSIAALIREARFTPVRLRQGYDMGSVDAHLDALHARAERGSPRA